MKINYIGGVSIETKICGKCKKEKLIIDFGRKNNKYLNRCKECINAYSREYNKNHKEQKRQKNKKYRDSHKEQIEASRKKWLELNKEHKKEMDRKYQKEHRETKREYYREYIKKRKQEDKIFKIKCNVRNVIYYSFLRKRYKKSEHTNELLGCSIDYFTNHLLETFKKRYGYEYDGKEKVHIDHIKPLKYANTEEEIIGLCHYTNLQLLKAEDNLKKGFNLEE